MQKIGPATTANLFFQINWNSPGVQHADAVAGFDVNFWRDLLPEQLLEALWDKIPGDLIRLKLPSDLLLDAIDKQDVRSVDRSRFDARRIGKIGLQPCSGRFYPKGLLRGFPGIFSANMTPFRCVQVANGHLDIDLGHPLSAKEIDLIVTVGSVHSKSEERGGSMRNWGELITRGVGMQARWQDQPTDFSMHAPMQRLDESADANFYARPRMVHHIDDTARDMLRQIQARFVRADMTALDLMSSWQTHIPGSIGLKKLIGLGLNEAELTGNRRLSDYRIHDLNADPTLPFENGFFDTVLCSLSVEYMIHPQAVFEEVGRILKPGGTFAVTFSNRWFEPKTIRLWTELHEFERMGLVLEYFRYTGLFENLHTYSVRGLVRPANDKYFGRLPFSDPVYAVWGKRKG